MSDQVTLECPSGYLIRALRYFDRSKMDSHTGMYHPMLMICLRCSLESSADNTLMVCRDELPYNDPIRTHEEGIINMMWPPCECVVYLMSHLFQVQCLGTSCGNGTGCGATFTLSKKNTHGLPSVTNISTDCGVFNKASATPDATNTNQGGAEPPKVTFELKQSALGNNEAFSDPDDIKYLSTAAVSGSIALSILIAITAYCICRRGRRNTSNIRVSKQIPYILKAFFATTGSHIA